MVPPRHVTRYVYTYTGCLRETRLRPIVSLMETRAVDYGDRQLFIGNYILLSKSSSGRWQLYLEIDRVTMIQRVDA